MIPEAVSEHYRSQQRLIVATLAVTRAAWRRMTEDFDASWSSVGPLLTVATTRAQLAAAASGASYIGATLAEVGTDIAPEGQVAPRAFAGVASDGRSLAGVLEGAKVRAKDAVSAGADPAAALAAGGRWLDMAVHTQVADAARGGAAVGITVRPKLGWTRMLNPPSCSRCAVQAGKWFRHNQGFQRHNRCDCRHIPSTEAMSGDFATDPREYFDSLSEAEQDRIFTKSGAAALRDGADMSRVVNARSGMSSSYKRLDRIYAQAHSREETLRLLQQHGFIRP